MVHEVPGWDSDSDWVEDEEQDELEQDPLMVIQDRVKPAKLREMTVANVCSASLLLQSSIHRAADSRQTLSAMV